LNDEKPVVCRTGENPLTQSDPTMPSRHESERRIATILFADISGFTAMSEKHDPEEVTLLMNETFGLMGRIIERHEGRIDKFMGDCVMATFGVPTAIENAPQKAVNTAIEIRNQIRQANRSRKLPVPLDVHIGINTGPVISGFVGTDNKQEFTVMGDAVNLASRFEDASTTGQILVGRDTWLATREALDYKELPPVSLKGKEQSVPVYELLSTRPKIERRKPAADRMIQSVIVGREAELNKLEFQIHKAINGEGSIVTVIGEAGIGKSRLIAELKTRDVMQRVTLLEGRAISIGRSLSFYPIIGFLKQWAAIGEDDLQAEQLSKLEKLVKRIWPEQLAEVVPFVATLMGLPLSGKHAERLSIVEPENLDKMVMKNLREFLRQATRTQTFVFILDDLHWADTSSLELLGFLFKLAETQKILFINVFRPRYEETGEKLIQTIQDKYPERLVRIELQPLGERDSDTLVDNLLNIRGLPVRIRRQILERAGGNPFFIEEVVRSFIDSGAVVRKKDGFEVTGKIETAVVPQTINEVLMARIDQLDDKTRHLVKLASVIGRNFFHKILGEVADTVEDLEGKLSYLEEIQMIRENQRLEEIEYLFKHALAQEAAYESILLQKRKELHGKVAQSIEKVFNERLHEFYGMLAYHYSNAEDLDKAEEYLIKAGQQAIQSSAPSEALEYFQNAIKLYEQKQTDRRNDDTLALLEENLALAYYRKGYFTDALPYFDKVLARLGHSIPTSPIRLYPKALIGIVSLLLRFYLPALSGNATPSAKEVKVASLYLVRTMCLVQGNPKQFLLNVLYEMWFGRKFRIGQESAYAYAVLPAASVQLAFMRGNLGQRILDEITRQSEGSLDINTQLKMELGRTTYNFFSGHWAKRDLDDRIEAFLAIGDCYTLTGIFLILGLQSVYQGEFGKTEYFLNRLQCLHADFDNEFALTYYLTLKSFLFWEQRRLEEAFEAARSSLNVREISHNSRVMRLGKMLIGYVLLRELDLAQKIIEEIEHLIQRERVSDYYFSNYSLGYLAYTIHRLRQSPPEQASLLKTDLAKAIQRSTKNARAMVYTRPETYQLFGIYHWHLNRQKKALKWFRRSIREAEKLGARPELARTWREVGHRLLEPGSKHRQLDGIDGRTYLNKARAVFEELDLQWDLDRLPGRR